MIFYSFHEMAAMLLAAIVIDMLIGDPKWLLHPVVLIGRWISWMEKKLRGSEAARHPRILLQGAVLTITTLSLSFAVTWLIVLAASSLHQWLGYAVTTWLTASTIAIKGLKDAAYAVLRPLRKGNLNEARTYTGYIVGRDTSQLGEDGLTRAVVETVAENTVDAVVAPLFYALLGAAPLAMLYRAANTLDSMVGYRNAKYIYFGRASARWDDVMNYLPARLTGILLVLAALITPKLTAINAARAIKQFARLHPSPNSGIPESAVAGALGIELGGPNVYDGRTSERARLGWPLRPRAQHDIRKTVKLLYTVSLMIAGGLVCALFVIYICFY